MENKKLVILPEEAVLYNRLRDYTKNIEGVLHMPGHKRSLEILCETEKVDEKSENRGFDPFEIDVTEVKGTDDLHDADGILREAMERTAYLAGAERTWFLVNGSTCGVLAGIFSAVEYGSEIIAARNCHRSVYHAIELLGLRVHWLIPETDPDFGLCESVDPKEVKRLLREHPAVRMMILTSPTYEGVISDIASIAEACHENDVLLMVDEAHGSHLGLRDGEVFPDGALKCGADIVVQSPHKTLFGCTQTALLHCRGNLADPERIERGLDIFETSSPSYPLMCSLDACTGILLHRGKQILHAWDEKLCAFDTECAELKLFRMYGRKHREDGCFEFDRSKILINCRGAEMTGAYLAEILRNEFSLETEMSSAETVLAMTGAGDAAGTYEESALHKLFLALRSIENKVHPCLKTGEASFIYEKTEIDTCMTIAEAVRKKKEEVPLSQAEGRISAEYCYAYPPGIPVIAPGERITRGQLEMLRRIKKSGNTVYRKKGETINCLDKDCE